MMKYNVLQAKNSSHSLFFILFKGCVTEYLRKFPLTNFQTCITYQPNYQNQSLNMERASSHSELSNEL